MLISATFAISTAAALSLGACQSAPVAATPAVFTSADTASMAVLRDTLAGALKVGRVELGPGDPAHTPVITVLPARVGDFEGRSTALPVVFDITVIGATCYVVRRDTGDRFRLSGVACKPFEG